MTIGALWRFAITNHPSFGFNAKKSAFVNRQPVHKQSQYQNRFSACFVNCPLLMHHVPESVSVVSRGVIDKKPGTGVTNQLDVGNRANRTVPDADLGVCVKPIHNRYNKTREILEFVEMNKILGVKRFTFYNHTMSPEVSCVLRQALFLDSSCHLVNSFLLSK